MNILQITSSFFPVMGGQEKVVYELSKGLINCGHKVTILTTNLFSNNKKFKSEENLEGIKIIRFKNNLFLGGYGFSLDAINWLKKNFDKYDLIHCHGYNRFLSEFAIKIINKKKPIIFSPHGFIHTKKNYFFKIIHDLTMGKIIRKANICTALTKLDYKEYTRLGVKMEKIIELPNGVNINKFSETNLKEIKKFREKYKLKENVLLYVGRIHKSKGLQYILEAIKDLNVNFLIIGKDGGYKKELERMIKKWNLGKKIIFTGPLNEKDLITAYKSSNIFLLFSEWEGFGIVVIESLAAGTPVIVSDRGALPQLIKNNQNGLIVKFKDVENLKEKIIELLKNTKMKNKIIKNGIKFSKDYSWESIIKKTEKIYLNQI